MTAITPLKAIYTGLELTALGEFESGETLAVEHGGTGSTSASAARAALGLVIGTDVQAFDADLNAIAGLSGIGFIRKNAAGNWVIEASNPDGNYAQSAVTTSRTLDAGSQYVCGSGSSIAADATLTIPVNSRLVVHAYTKEVQL